MNLLLYYQNILPEHDHVLVLFSINMGTPIPLRTQSCSHVIFYQCGYSSTLENTIVFSPFNSCSSVTWSGPHPRVVKSKPYINSCVLRLGFSNLFYFASNIHTILNKGMSEY